MVQDAILISEVERGVGVMSDAIGSVTRMPKKMHGSIVATDNKDGEYTRDRGSEMRMSRRRKSWGEFIGLCCRRIRTNQASGRWRAPALHVERRLYATGRFYGGHRTTKTRFVSKI